MGNCKSKMREREEPKTGLNRVNTSALLKVSHSFEDLIQAKEVN